MSDEQHMTFTRQFGELEFNPSALIEKRYGVKTENERPVSRHPAGDRGHFQYH